MPTATTTTTTTTTAMSENQPSQPTTATFTPGQCLFCPSTSPTFPASVCHMQTRHGLFVPCQGLVVDLETLFAYLHLVIFGYRACLQCGTERATVQAVQQHMASKGHCRIDTCDADSEFADFYEGSTGGGGERGTRTEVLGHGEEPFRLPSGRMVCRKGAPASEGAMRRRGRVGALHGPLSLTREQRVTDPDTDAASLCRREKRDLALATRQLANMRASDRSGLMHMPTSQQRATLLAQHRQLDKTQKENTRKQAHVDGKGNKNLYAYWATETPVYLCG